MLLSRIFARVAGRRAKTSRGRNQARIRAKTRYPLTLEPFEDRILLNAVVWDGGGSNRSWLTPANWVGDVVPAPGDIATFNGTSTKDCNITANINVAGIDIQSGYTGRITQFASAAITVGSSNYKQADGTFNGAAGTVQVNGNVQLDGGDLFTPTGTFTVSGNWTRSGGIFHPKSATVTFNGTGDQTIDSGQGQTFAGLAVTKPSGIVTFANFGFNATTLSVAAGDNVHFQAGAKFKITNLTDRCANSATLDS